MILGIEDKWIALACLLRIALLPSLLMVLASSFTRKPDEAHLGFCFSFNKKNNEEKI
jgi:hypothetical protein